MSDQSKGPEGWDAIGASWRADAPASTSFGAVDSEAVRARASGFARKIRRRNVRELVAGVLVAIAGGRIAYRASSLLDLLGGVSMALGALIVTAIIVLRARNASPPPHDAPTREVIAFERLELERQARLLERVWIWYLAPLVPSIVAIYAASLSSALAREDHDAAVGVIVLRFGVTIGVFVLIGWLNARAARGLRSRMAALPADDMHRD